MKFKDLCWKNAFHTGFTILFASRGILSGGVYSGSWGREFILGGGVILGRWGLKSIIKFRVDGYYEWVAVTNGRINNFRPPVATNLSRTAPWFGKGCILSPTVRGGWERLRFKPHCSRGWAKCVLSRTVRGFWSRSRNQIPSKTIVKSCPKQVVSGTFS